MVIGYDAKKIVYDNDDTAEYGREMIDALSACYIHNHYMIYTPKARENKLLASFLSRSTVHEKTPRHAIIGWKWRRGKGILRDARRHGVRVLHGLDGMLPSALAQSHMHAVVSVPFTRFLVADEPCGWLERRRAMHDVDNACAIAERVVTATHTAKQMLVRQFGVDPEKVCVVPPSCDEKYHRAFSDNELNSTAHKYGLPQRFILYMGELTEKGGIMLLAEALNAMREEDVKLVLIGKSNAYYQNKVKEFAHRHGIRHRILHFDKVHSSDIPAILHLAEVLALPVARQHNVMPLVKAVSSLTPVVVAQDAMAQEVGGDAVICAQPGDFQSFADTFDALLGSGDKRATLAGAAKERRTLFTHQAMADSMMAIYDKVCEHHHIR